jgi:signal transduction histidine kinase
LTAEQAVLQAALAGLPEQPPSQQTERVGWHSQSTLDDQKTKWIQLDFGGPEKIDAVALLPADVRLENREATSYGFPRRFRIEGADTADFAAPRLLIAQDDVDFPNPGLAPVWFSFPEARVRFVRITATRLWQRGDRAIMALGEVFVLHGERNLSAGARVTSSDTVESPPTWQQANAVDGQSALGTVVEERRTAGYGWHSKIESDEFTPKWVQLDLGRDHPIDEIRLYPACPRNFPTRPGFGFPLQFRVEAARTVDFRDATTLFATGAEDFLNPGENPVFISGRGHVARFVRITATRLWRRIDDFAFALAEAEVWSGQRNVAAGGAVTALDSAEHSTWSRAFLVDGETSRGRITRWHDTLAALSQRRDTLRRLKEIEEEKVALAAQIRRWAAWLGLGGSGTLAVVAAGWSVRLRRRKRREIEAVRQQISADLHDEIGSNLGTIALLARVAAGQPAQAASDLAEIQRVARVTAESMHDLIWFIRPAGDAANFATKLRDTATTMLAHLPFTFRGDGSGRALSLEAKRAVFLIFKEALHNIQRHAQATQVSISLEETASALVLEIADDGIGFAPAASGRGLGLQSQRHRADQLGAELTVESAPGRGTRVRLRVRWGTERQPPSP